VNLGRAACVAAHLSPKYHARRFMVTITNVTRTIVRGCADGSGSNGGYLSIGRGGGGGVGRVSACL
jgi:hypothetical protein